MNPRATPISSVLDLYRQIDVKFIGAAYWEALEVTYARTVHDVHQIAQSLGKPRAEVRILEIGSFAGIVATALRLDGFAVTAFDLPLFMNDAALRQHYERIGVSTACGDLSSLPLALPAGGFDIVICCEVIEHLNFNPIHTFCEFNRLLASGGFLYLGTPNQANIVKRLLLLRGRSIHSPVKPDLVWQLNPKATFSIGLHWREFTAAELAQLLVLTGFAVTRQYFCHTTERRSSSPWRRAAVNLMYRLFPSFLPSQVAIGRKQESRTTDTVYHQSSTL